MMDFNLKNIFCLFFLLFIGISDTAVFAQENQEIEKPQHLIFVVPTSLGGSLWADLGNNVWIELGFSRVSNRNVLTFTSSSIVHSWEQTGLFYPNPKFSNWLNSGVTQIRSNGFKVGFEYSRLLNKHFYVGGQAYYQQTVTTRLEQYFLDEQNPQMLGTYSVTRHEIGLMPKFGFLFLLKRDLSCDIGLGIGGRYIASRAKGKKNPEGNLHQEYLTNKTFDSGTKFAQRISLQFRIGYAF